MTVTVDVTDAGPIDPATDARRPDVYFTSGYGEAVAADGSGSWRLAHHDDDLVLLPYLLRPVADDAADAVSPYGYCGIHVAPECPASELVAFWSALGDRWRAEGVVSLFLRFSPLDPASVDAVRDLDGMSLTRRADTVTVPVRTASADIWDGMEGRSRTAIRKARRGGMHGTVRPAGAEDVDAGSPFRRLYESTMTRVGSTAGYFFPEVYYQRLLTGLGPSLSLAEVRDGSSAVVAAALVLRHGGRVHYHLAGSRPEAAREGANNMLVWTILEWAAETGADVVHLGGGLQADDNLFRFKRAFGGLRTPFWTGAVVLDPERYERLTEERAARVGLPAAHLRQSGYFPAYRFGGA
ncbi:Acetyltransferase (GNAT) domain-containing protein [Micromonospora sediminicola]|uniref:Acetyltransferase (GNAT) domain-containing protein n=1 Tax=Micromonospora sediminicola TaxID=946078 RepID=A0A1A9BFG7_9ACTN|nr:MULTISPECIES: GNAT family N-acetyltransferase [Micromonospora]PGH45675.1 GNAT family N-acetyltransferase [Micromonospora sp. WMMA1996]SBT67597.1 Acetyltransferase (GNAT) domain-containing protein [Micromonospora sediminicola]